MATRAPARARATTPPKGRPTPQRPRQTRPKGEVLEYNGKEYKLATKIGVWPLMQLARAAQEGVNSTDMRGMAALHAMFEDMIDPEDWPQFEADMISSKMQDPMALLMTTQDAVLRIQARNARASAGVVRAEIEE